MKDEKDFDNAENGTEALPSGTNSKKEEHRMCSKKPGNPGGETLGTEQVTLLGQVTGGPQGLAKTGGPYSASRQVGRTQIWPSLGKGQKPVRSCC